MAALKALVIGMGVLIVAGTVTLVVLLVQRSGGGAPPGRGAHVATELRAAAGGAEGRPIGGAPQLRPFNVVLGEPAGSRVAGIAAAGGALAIWVVRPDGERVVLVDPATGLTTGEIRLRD